MIGWRRDHADASALSLCGELVSCVCVGVGRSDMFGLLYHAHAFGTMNKPFEAPQVLGFCSSVSRLTRLREVHDRSMSLRARVSAAP